VRSGENGQKTMSIASNRLPTMCSKLKYCVEVEERNSFYFPSTSTTNFNSILLYTFPMKTYTGSLQKRGRRYYLVVHRDGRQRWFALKTDKLPVARMRAAKIAPADPNDETAWLKQLVREGEAARRKLVAAQAKQEITWENIGQICDGLGDMASSADSRYSHGRWLRILAKSVKKAVNNVPPGMLTKELADRVLRLISGKYLSAARMLTFYRKAWSRLHLDEDIWPMHMPTTADPSPKANEHYRRLAIEEVRRVHVHLTAVAPPLADMVLLGYSTGLRLSDVAELELSEIDGAFLRLCPNKTRRHKPQPLRIPLTPEAQAVVRRLVAAAVAQKQRFVFDKADRHRPSRRIAAAFRKCGVGRIENGRASFHSLRATFISRMDEAGIPPHVTDSITGHGGGGMHARYTQPSDAALMAAVVRSTDSLSRGDL